MKLAVTTVINRTDMMIRFILLTLQGDFLYHKLTLEKSNKFICMKIQPEIKELKRSAMNNYSFKLMVSAK